MDTSVHVYCLQHMFTISVLYCNGKTRFDVIEDVNGKLNISSVISSVTCRRSLRSANFLFHVQKALYMRRMMSASHCLQFNSYRLLEHSNLRMKNEPFHEKTCLSKFETRYLQEDPSLLN